MSPLIFFDANVYLSAYREGYKDYLTFLNEAEEIIPYILITKQIVREVNRNRLSTYLQYFRGLQNKPSVLPGALVHYQKTRDEIDKSESKYKCLKAKITDAEKELNEFIDEIHKENIATISKGNDYVWLSLQPFFCNAVTETRDQLLRARKRKEIGDPPGKTKDSLGDQINWEQLLDKARHGGGPIMIVTNDHDYYHNIGGILHLEPSLYDELRDVSDDREVLVFEKAPDCIKHIKEKQLLKDKKLPTEELIAAANNEIEFERSSIKSKLIGLPWSGGVLISTLEESCRNSPTGEHQVGGAALFPSAFRGYKTFQGHCSYCGQWIDTLDDCD